MLRGITKLRLYAKKLNNLLFKTIFRRYWPQMLINSKKSIRHIAKKTIYKILSYILANTTKKTAISLILMIILSETIIVFHFYSTINNISYYITIPVYLFLLLINILISIYIPYIAKVLARKKLFDLINSRGKHLKETYYYFVEKKDCLPVATILLTTGNGLLVSLSEFFLRNYRDNEHNFLQDNTLPILFPLGIIFFVLILNVIYPHYVYYSHITNRLSNKIKMPVSEILPPTSKEMLQK